MREMPKLEPSVGILDFDGESGGLREAGLVTGDGVDLIENAG